MQINRYLKWTDAQLAKMPTLGQVKYLIIHHTAGADVPVEEIDRQHKARKYIGAGYHYLIRHSGQVEKGRPDNKEGAHCKDHNLVSLGIALSGNLSKFPPTPEQMNALEGLLAELMIKYPAAQVVGHMRLNPTECPGNLFPWNDLWDRLEKKPALDGVPEWARPAVQWAVNNKIINTPAGDETFYRCAVMIYQNEKRKGSA
jgi:N-acetylmuramoyl-L-alanine amidase